MAKLLMSCMSPRRSFIVNLCLKARKWTMSKASACTSDIGGTPGVRGDVGEPVIGRLVLLASNREDLRLATWCRESNRLFSTWVIIANPREILYLSKFMRPV